MGESPVLPGRACGDCTLCCTILGVDELNKPRNTACPNSMECGGCAIYPDRPAGCRDFYCGYLTLPMVHSGWYPANSGMVVYPAPSGDRLEIHVDPARPGIWRSEPFQSEILGWARRVAHLDFEVVVIEDGEAIPIRA